MTAPRAKVLALAFAMLVVASAVMIAREGTVDARAWALLVLAAIFAAAAVIAFFSAAERTETDGGRIRAVTHDDTRERGLPDPAEAGFDIPVL